MPRPSKSTRSHKKTAKAGEYHSPQEIVVSPSTVVAAAQIPGFRSQLPYRKSFRYQLNNGSALATAWTTTMMLDAYCTAVGGSATPARLYNNMKLLGVKVWSASTAVGEAAAPNTALILEFSPSLIAGFGGAPRVPYTSDALGPTKYAHICAKPKANELASQWFSAQQGNYTLFNLYAGSDAILQLDFLVTEVNGETPVSCAYTSSVAKGTVGVTNFGLSGCRSIGLENLVNP